jgi:hypothetical protein
MNLKEKIFGRFDFSCVDDAEYKEDAVREDIIAPLLRRIGYSPGGPNKIIRSRSLTHPYALFGSKKRKIKIIPDYILEVEDEPCFVLDAKSPSQGITRGDNVAQVYSYAIHPEIRAWNYGLCNGRSLALFEVSSIKPKQIYDLTNLDDTTILDINQKLNPRTIKSNVILDYNLDGGTYLHFVMDIPLNMDLHFFDVLIPNLGMISEDHYTISVVCTNMADRDLMFTFDFDKSLYTKLLSQLSPAVANVVQQDMKSQPFIYKNTTNPPSTHIDCRLTAEPPFTRTGEMFFPLQVKDFPQRLSK